MPDENKRKHQTIAITVKTTDGKFVTRPYQVTRPIRLCLLPTALEPTKGGCHALYT